MTEPNAPPTRLPQVLIVHPSAPKARTLPKQSLPDTAMPKGFPARTLEAAFDLSGGGQPEIIQVRYCCGSPELTIADSACTKAGSVQCVALFRKTKGGWQRVFRGQDVDC